MITENWKIFFHLQTLLFLLSFGLLQKLLASPSAKNWKKFLTEYGKVIFYPIRQFTDDEDERMELYVYVCESLARNNFARLKRYQQRSGAIQAKFTTWLISIVKNLCIDWYRKREGRFRLYKAVDNLSALDKEIFELIFLRGFSIEEAFEIITQDKIERSDAEKFSESLQRIQQCLSRSNRQKLLNMLIRRRDRGKFSLLASGFDDQAQISSTDFLQPDQKLQQEMISQVLKEIINEMSSEDRFLLKLWFESELPARRIAEILGWRKTHKVYSRINTILRQLRARLQEKNIRYEDLESLGDIEFFL